MKRITLSFCFALLALLVYAQTVTKSVTLTTPGTLNTFFTTTEANTVTNLTLSGNIDARDFAFLRDKVALLAVLDISTAKIKAYTGLDGTYTVTSITYPANELPLCAFYNTNTYLSKYSLTTIKLPASLTSIGGSAFYYCTGLSGIFSIPASVTSIGDYALYGCSQLSEYQVVAANTRYSSNNGVLFNKKQDSLFVCPGAKAGSYTIPSTVVSIGASAFDGCSLLTGSLTLPASVKSIGSYAFYYCTGFTGSLTLSANLIQLDEGAFYGCSGLTGIVTIPKSLRSLGSYTFFDCSSLSSFQVDPLNAYYSSVNDVLYNKLQDTLYVCPGAKVGSLSLPASVKGIGSYAFYGCSKLTAYEVDPLNTAYRSSEGVLFTKNQDILLVCPTTKTGSYVIPNTVKTIGTYAFFYCNSLTGSISIPASVTTIGDYAFYGCSKLSAFEVESANPLYSSVEGVLLNRNKDSLFICPVGKTGKYILPNTVTAIDYSSFDQCVGLTEIVFPNSVTSIGKYAFYYCTGLTSIVLPKNLTTIGSGSFYGCSNLLQFEIANPIPPTVDYYTFLYANQAACKLFVPIGSATSYQSALYWKNFLSVSEKVFTNIEKSFPDRSSIQVYTRLNEIIVQGVQEGERMDVYTMDGKRITTVKSAGSKRFIAAQKGRSYIVRIQGKTVKVTL